eukprot:gnl/MRDRNA2_/MRDRNA2_34211_c0_seq1.p1 gnl/MRDRNA2_/MRDRNA2_34211_c0~~gnl/MRDRNA2_/MRDRNA2_34211_c0_seq1.p1  ORF type:complete len:296 (+),score=45.92 gnl/MRDRNA2_/MRDRNA2_34211_c0_seq1:206-1093(+)
MKRQQCHVLYGALLVSACGLALMGFAKCVLWTDRIVHVTGQWLPYVALALALTVLAAGVLGVVGAMLSSTSALISYTSFSCIASGALLFAGRLFVLSVDRVKDGVEDACASLGLSSAHSTKIGFGPSLVASDKSFRQALANCQRSGRQNAKTLEDCGQLAQDNDGHWYQDDPNIQWFAWLEATGCGGFCSAGKPLLKQNLEPVPLNAHTCAEELVQELDLRGALYAGLVAGACVPLLLAAVGTCCILCDPPKPRRFRLVGQHQGPGTLMAVRRAHDDSDEDDGTSEVEVESSGLL